MKSYLKDSNLNKYFSIDAGESRVQELNLPGANYEFAA